MIKAAIFDCTLCGAEFRVDGDPTDEEVASHTVRGAGGPVGDEWGAYRLMLTRPEAGHVVQCMPVCPGCWQAIERAVEERRAAQATAPTRR